MELTNKQIEAIIDAIIDELEYEVDFQGDPFVQAYISEEGFRRIKKLMEVM